MMRGNPTLLGAAKRWPTPRARDWKGPVPLERRPICDDDLATRVERIGLPAPTTPTGGETTSSGGRVLNPLFVEALMCLPRGWTIASIDFGPSATEWSRYKQRLRSAFSRIV